MIRGQRAAPVLLALCIQLAGCGDAPRPSQAFDVSPDHTSNPTVGTPTPVATKSIHLPGSVVFTGWVDGLPAVAIRDGGGQRPAWHLQSGATSGWRRRGDLPDGSSPVTDGATVANVPDPESGTDMALLLGSDAARLITLPQAAWVAQWRRTHGLVPVAKGAGYLLTGASAIAVVDDEGAVTVRAVPDGYVALAPTADSKQFLLATAADAAEAGGLSESTPFGAYVWTVGSSDAPMVVAQRVVAVAPSSVGLAWLRTSDGVWGSLVASGAVVPFTRATTQRTLVSQDGSYLVRFSDSGTGCVTESADPCPVGLVDSSGSTHVFDGPADGAGFDAHDVGIVLFARTRLNLPWRLVSGPAAQPSTVVIE